MYAPRHFDEARLDVLHRLIADHPLGTLVTHDADGLCADHLPFEIAAPSAQAPLGTLRGHVARANPVWQREEEVLLVFQGEQGYISPSWYEEKARSGQVVPTYNYAVVHAHGRLRAVHDADWLLALLERLTARHEADRPAPWQVADAPRAYIDKMLGAIVGIEIDVTRIQGKWKLSQNRPGADQTRVAVGLADSGDAGAAALAQLMRSIQAPK